MNLIFKILIAIGILTCILLISFIIFVIYFVIDYKLTKRKQYLN